MHTEYPRSVRIGYYICIFRIRSLLLVQTFLSRDGLIQEESLALDASSEHLGVDGIRLNTAKAFVQVSDSVQTRRKFLRVLGHNESVRLFKCGR